MSITQILGEKAIFQGVLKPRVGLVSLGCAKNLVDSEVMLGLLQQAGYPLTPRAQEADILIVNTCAFIDAAKDEAIQTIIEMGQYKAEGNCKLLIVAGCLAQRYQAELSSQLPEIDAIVGTGQFPQIVQICRQLLAAPSRSAQSWVGRPDYLYDHATPRRLTTPSHSAYLKIAEGCNHRCTYCIIPQLRGPLRSRPLQSILAEAQDLAARGVKEINLIAQDTTAYGQDLSAEHNLLNLLPQLAQIEGLQWFRLLYGHPAHLSPQLLQLIAAEDKICSYIDLPLQHIHDQVLQRMGRRLGRKEIEELIARMRSLIPDLTLRTSLLVGFPGETDEHFQALLDFVQQTRFDCLGVFAYSQEEGTPAAEFPEQVPEKLKEQRRDDLLQAQQRIAFQRNQALVGSRQQVLIESAKPLNGYLGQGRTRGQAPQVDGVVYLQKGRLKTGEIVSVEITAAQGYDLVGKVITDAC